ncbi:dnaJ homolog subfamily C member 16-like [Gigantopelta aegis]|uniref:dnaJ homolog subfamily C member 16-like n=1 Tax=Gigantopelta aegis TaxID=1735272 RepID=UPI001B88D2D3|nr:dnaJ homolog subfamily C member 16-like [Gigantopelta aegis]
MMNGFQYILCASLLIHIYASEDLYDVLDVNKDASSNDIRQAYKRLAREWHPDKNKAPDAADKFTKINEAYETLSNPEKRSAYDNYGYTSQNGRRQPFHQPNGFFPFDDFFSGSGFNFNFGKGSSILDRYSTTLRHFEMRLLPESHKTPCFIYLHSSFCFECMRIEPYIEKFIAELETVGLCIGTAHMAVNRGISSHLRIHDVPAIVGLVNGRPTFFSGPVNLQTLREFVRNWFPKDTLTNVDDNNYETFISGWRDNHVRAIFFSHRDRPSTRFLAPAFLYRDYVTFGYVNMKSESITNLMKRFGVNQNHESLLLFNEESVPVATISMKQLQRKTLDEVIEQNRFLILPRLSSQKHFDELCPVQPKVARRSFCIVLVTKESEDHDYHRSTFRDFAQSSRTPPSRVKYVYIYEEKQSNFIGALLKGNKTRQESVLEVAIIWRVDKKKVNYEFLEDGWSSDTHLNSISRKRLEERLTSLLTSDHLLPYRVTYPELYNEHALGLLTRILYRLLDWADRAYMYALGYDTTVYLTVLMSVFLVVVMGLFMHHLATIEEQQVQQTRAAARDMKRPQSVFQDSKLHLYELKFETYVNLVKEADTGLTIVVFVGETSREPLCTKFAALMYPYARYSALTFAFLRLEYYISWYQHLLEESLDFKLKLDNINIRNCLGTVLAINGYRKYFYIYHPKNTLPWMRKHSNISKSIGFFDDDSDPEMEDKPVEHLLDGLCLWVDKMFDGSVKKIRIPYWPDMFS